MTQTPEIQDEMPKAYEPKKTEAKWFKFWLDNNYFRAEIDPNKKPFTVIMPLPNVTGGLHMGHVCFLTPEDILTRWHRMKGDSALWLPGIDHAGIGAQVVVERILAEEGIDRHQLGRDKFVERMYRWAVECRKTITEQEQRLGSSCDWSRERFTLEEGPSRAVRTAFVRLYEKGLVYQGERIVNWCPRCATAISDLETEHRETTGHLYYVRYHLVESDDFITVATTRPETILGDTAVAVSPKDERFKDMVGKKVILPAVNRIIPVVADEAVEPAFGTGAVKITPGHDPVDFEVAQRQGLPLVNILNPDATMNDNAGPYAGLDRFACREAILTDLEKEGLLVKIEPYTHSVGHCDRCRTLIEPLASKQWFINTKPLAKPAIEAVLDGRITIIPGRFIKVYLNWMENIRDWCISRQLWWGHRIPVWYCQDCGELTVTVEDARTCSHCGSTNIEQDPDVLDTWFSSSLWTHSTLGWPDDTEDLRYFYPTTVMETGTIDEYGADALRFAVMTGAAPGNDIKPSPVKLEAGRNFANKLWNATRFVVRNIGPGRTSTEIQRDLLPTEDRWILSRLSSTVSSVNSLMDDFQFGEALRQIYDFLWGEFCDWYIELAKIRLRTNAEKAPSPLPVLFHVLETSLRLLHPYMPFITEELWQNLKQRLPADWQAADSIVVSTYPEAEAGAIDSEAERIIEAIIDIIRSIRNARAQHKVESTRWIEAHVYGGELTQAITPYSEAIQTLARARPLGFHDEAEESPPGENTLVLVLKETEVVIPMESVVDLEAEGKRLYKEIEQNQAEVARLEARLKDRAFLDKAPAAVVDKERDRLVERKDKLERLNQQLERLG